MNALKENKPFFSKGNNEKIFKELRSKANEVVAQLEMSRRPGILLKAFLFPVLYFACWATAMLFGENPYTLYSCYFGLGIFLVLNYLNIIHDAVHHTIFKSRKLNELYVYLFDLMGANSFIWKMRHIRFHHNYPNVDGWDTDIDQSKIFRVAPQSPPTKLHKYQHYYLPLFILFFFLTGCWFVILKTSLLKAEP